VIPDTLDGGLIEGTISLYPQVEVHGCTVPAQFVPARITGGYDSFADILQQFVAIFRSIERYAFAVVAVPMKALIAFGMTNCWPVVIVFTGHAHLLLGMTAMTSLGSAQRRPRRATHMRCSGRKCRLTLER
jgi:hypothetical protein